MSRVNYAGMALGIVGVAVLLSACSGTKAEPTFPTEDADSVARDMIPDPAVFPGSGWRAVDSESEDPGDPLDDAEIASMCDGLADRLKPLEDLDTEENQPAGTAAQEFELLEAKRTAPLPMSVEVSTEVYDAGRTKALKEIVSVTGTVFGSSEWGDCMAKSAALGVTEAGVVIDEGSLKFDHASPMVGAPRSGFGWAVQGTFAVQGTPFEMRMEMYGWQVGNATITVFISGDKSHVTTEFLENLLARVDGQALIAGHGS